MNDLKKNMIQILADLKENHHVIGVKVEFGTEGATLEEAVLLKEIAAKSGLEMTIKIGGCEAIRDIADARTIGINTIVAPMIETAYSLKKYVKSVQSVFSEIERKNINFLINIETISGFNNIDEILSIKEAERISGIVLGRDDMVDSMNLSRENINSDEMFNMAVQLVNKANKYNKEIGIGGTVSRDFIPFFFKFPIRSFTRFETRKIIFDATKMMTNMDMANGLMKALKYELMWLENKRDFNRTFDEEDNRRFQMLKQRYTELAVEFGDIYA